MDSPEFEAGVIVARCVGDHGLFGMRVQRSREDGRSSDWWATWSFALDEGTIAAEPGYGASLSGSFDVAPGHRACCLCGAVAFFQCGSCQKISCWDGAQNFVTCSWCGNAGALSGHISSVSGSSDH